jgi:hypothetical protein
MIPYTMAIHSMQLILKVLLYKVIVEKRTNWKSVQTVKITNELFVQLKLNQKKIIKNKIKRDEGEKFLLLYLP